MNHALLKSQPQVHAVKSGQRNNIGLPQLMSVLGFTGVLIALVFVIAPQPEPGSHSQIPQLIKSVVYSQPVKLKPFHLSAHDGTTFNLDRMKNQWTFVFFGYTQCPDVCPATINQLVRVKSAFDELNGEQFDTRMVFISVDPNRDTLPELTQYIRYFDEGEGFVAATGDLAQIKNVEDQFGVFHRYAKANSEGEYRVDHSADIFLVDPMARVSAKFQVPMNVSQVVQQYAGIVDFYKQKI